MKKNFTIIIMLLFMAACSKNDGFVINSEKETTDEITPMDPIEINTEIKTILLEKGNFNWNEASDYMVWSASAHGKNIVTIGFGNTSFIKSKNTENDAIKSFIIQKVINLENIANPNKKSENSILLYEDEVLNFIDIEVQSIETIKTLRLDENIRYIEPSGYEFFAHEDKLKSSSGCTTSADAVNSADYRTISPNCLVSWTYDEHNITQAWTLSTGQGITVGLIDTGVSNYQSLLGTGFNDGYSTGRNIQKFGSYVDSWKWWSTSTDGYHDKCGHGTLMAATIASPRNDNNLPVGVAYNCNLVSYRGTSDVVLDGYQEQKGVANALTALANNSSVKIISMSIGHIFSVGRIRDAVRYAYAKDKMIIAAGGTSTSFTNFVGVIFPANMDETIAVTGVTNSTSYNECDVCHKGSAIDFTVVMERYWDNNRHSACLGYYDNTKDYVGGSSVATSTTAGIAALIWARHPTWSRAQVFNKMKQSAELYSNPSSNFGYGNINAYLAVL